MQNQREVNERIEEIKKRLEEKLKTEDVETIIESAFSIEEVSEVTGGERIPVNFILWFNIFGGTVKLETTGIHKIFFDSKVIESVLLEPEIREKLEEIEDYLINLLYD